MRFAMGRHEHASVCGGTLLLDLSLRAEGKTGSRSAWEEAEQWYERGLQLSRDIQVRSEEMMFLRQLGTLTASTGKHSQGDKYFHRALELAQLLQDRSAYSFLRGASAPETLVAQAATLGTRALALTNFMTLAGVVRFQAACAQHDIQPIVGVELAFQEPPIFGVSPKPPTSSS